jgi:hypothetical protein
MTTSMRWLSPGSAGVDPRFRAATLAWASVFPLAHRLRRGEGLLLPINLSLVFLAEHEPRRLAAQVLISTAVLALLYLLNDVHDCHDDANDPAKDRAFVGLCATHRATLFRALFLEKIAVVLLALLVLGPGSASAAAAVFAVNLGYSFAVKRIAILDVPFVALWGALYALVPGVDVPIGLIALVGVMTAVCHVFQITRDREVDLSNRVRTSAAVSRVLPELQLACLCAAMGFLLYHLAGPAAAASAPAPLLFRRVAPGNALAWLLSKSYFGAIWIAALSLHAP